MTLLQTNGLTKVIDGTEILHNIDLEIENGEFVVVMGPSGSGKSTLLYCLSGMDGATSGHVSFENEDITSYSESQMTQLRANRFGFVFQQSQLVGSLSLYENILLGSMIGSGDSEEKSRQHTDALIAAMNLDKAKDRLPGSVSGGEAQRAALARAVAGNPTLLFADEPTGALNHQNTIQILDILTELNRKGQTILMVTHDREAAIRGSQVLFLRDGEIQGQCGLGSYAGDNPQRQQALGSWLEAMGW